MGVWGDVDRLSILARRAFEATHAAHGLRTYEFEVLAVLHQACPSRPPTPTELARTLLVSQGAMTDRIDRLVQRGWVERQPDPNDGRSVRVALTAEGQALVDRARKDLDAAQSQLLAVLTPTEQHVLEKAMAKLLAPLEN